MLLKTERIQKSIVRVRKFLKKKPKRPAPEKIHQLRTSVRRLESSLEVMDVGAKKLKKRLTRNLAILRKRLGKIRDMDVFTDHAISVGSTTSDRECLVQLLEYLGTKRSRQAKKLRNASKAVAPQLERDLRNLDEALQEAASDSGPNAQPVIASQSDSDVPLRDLAADLDNPAILHRGNLHPYRLKVKEFRYLLQLSREEHSRKLVNELGEVKDAIGEWHDLEELVLIARNVVRQGGRSKLIRQLKKTADARFSKAVTVAQHLRKTVRNGKLPSPLPS